MTKLHEEAQSQFKDIRQHLNNLTLERTGPKDKSSSKRGTKSDAAAAMPQIIVNNPQTDGLGGKAGKAQYLVQVGEVSNLYKSSKQRANSFATLKTVTIDLHGLTKQQAIETLDEHLPKWNDSAMSGFYPFVIPVEIICGCGNQILSEVVEQWIRSKENVSNAPKNLWGA